jgi:hypothetical protein
MRDEELERLKEIEEDKTPKEEPAQVSPVPTPEEPKRGGMIRGKRSDTKGEMDIPYTEENTAGDVRRALEASLGAQVKLISMAKEWGNEKRGCCGVRSDREARKADNRQTTRETRTGGEKARTGKKNEKDPVTGGANGGEREEVNPEDRSVRDHRKPSTGGGTREKLVIKELDTATRRECAQTNQHGSIVDKGTNSSRRMDPTAAQTSNGGIQEQEVRVGIRTECVEGAGSGRNPGSSADQKRGKTRRTSRMEIASRLARFQKHSRKSRSNGRESSKCSSTRM